MLAGWNTSGFADAAEVLLKSDRPGELLIHPAPRVTIDPVALTPNTYRILDAVDFGDSPGKTRIMSRAK